MHDLEQETSLGHVFGQPALLRQALTHASHSQPHNERLEFVGDSVLGCVITRELFERFPTLPEGDLSRLKASLVNEASLSEVAGALDLGSFVLLGESQAGSGGATRAILADVLEALIGAVFIDGGYDAARAATLRLFAIRLSALRPGETGKDPKTTLQEWLQARRMALPSYRTVSVQGDAHQRRFEVECAVESLGRVARGDGTSRRNAEQVAARELLRGLGLETCP
ncbi:MAG: ribonuclease III [Betaproteobacteria bacterium]|jgi:ribonuclease-3